MIASTTYLLLHICISQSQMNLLPMSPYALDHLGYAQVKDSSHELIRFVIVASIVHESLAFFSIKSRQQATS